MYHTNLVNINWLIKHDQHLDVLATERDPSVDKPKGGCGEGPLNRVPHNPTNGRSDLALHGAHIMCRLWKPAMT